MIKVGPERIQANRLLLFFEKHWYIILMSNIIIFGIVFCIKDCYQAKHRRYLAGINEANLLQIDDQDTIFTRGTLN